MRAALVLACSVVFACDGRIFDREPECAEDSVIEWGLVEGYFANHPSWSKILGCREWRHAPWGSAESVCRQTLDSPRRKHRVDEIRQLANHPVIASALASSAVFGADMRGRDGGIFRVSFGSRDLNVGSPCGEWKQCTPPPKEVQRLLDLLAALDRVELAEPACVDAIAQLAEKAKTAELERESEKRAFEAAKASYLEAQEFIRMPTTGRLVSWKKTGPVRLVEIGLFADGTVTTQGVRMSEYTDGLVPAPLRDDSVRTQQCDLSTVNSIRRTVETLGIKRGTFDGTRPSTECKFELVVGNGPDQSTLRVPCDAMGDSGSLGSVVNNLARAESLLATMDAARASVREVISWSIPCAPPAAAR